jgi:hypothetical protein
LGVKFTPTPTSRNDRAPACPTLPEHVPLVQKTAGSKPPPEQRRNACYAYRLESLSAAHPNRTPRSIYLSK